MFVGQGLGAGTLAAREGVKQQVVLLVGVEHPVAVRRHGALHGQHGGCGGKGQLVVQRHGDVQNQRVKAVVHAGVGSVGGVAFHRDECAAHRRARVRYA